MDHEVHHRDVDHGFAAFGKRFVVFAQTAILGEPTEGTLHNPAARQNGKSLLVTRAFDDVENPLPELRGPRHQGTGVAAVGPNPLESWKPASQFAQHVFRAVPILDVGGMHHDGKQQAQRIDDDMPLAARDFLARIVAVRPPFCGAAVLIDWLSTTAADGVDSRPASTRTFSRRAS